MSEDDLDELVEMLRHMAIMASSPLAAGAADAIERLRADLATANEDFSKLTDLWLNSPRMQWDDLPDLRPDPQQTADEEGCGAVVAAICSALVDDDEE